MSNKAATHETEARLVATWRAGAVPKPLMDSLGRSISVVFPGRRNGGPGPDFMDALLALPDGTLLRGDVEAHLKAADWYSHGHHTDPAYNGVILHIVRSGSAKVVTNLLGHSIPATIIPMNVAVPPEQAISCPPPNKEIAIGAVRAAGDRWFDDHIQRIQASVDWIGPSEAAWAGFLDCLGFGGNRDGFAALAEAVPWSILAPMIDRKPDPRSYAEMVLLGTAGLLPENQREEWRQLGIVDPLTPIRWSLKSIRPGNHPARRIAAAAAFAATGVGRSPAAMLVELVERAKTPRDVTAGVRRLAGDRIGEGLASAIAVNLVLPLAVVHEVRAARDLFPRFSRLPDNAPTTVMTDLLFAPDARTWIRGAREQQGLLYIERRWCRSKDCGSCMVGQAVQEAGTKPDNNSSGLAFDER